MGSASALTPVPPPAGVSGFRHDRSRSRYLAAYDAALGLWPVPYRSELIPTRYGSTHAIISGPETAPTVLLLPAGVGVGAVQWHPNAARLSAGHRVVALDFIGGPGRGAQSAPLLDRADHGRWLIDVLDEIGVERADVVGSSHGGWIALDFAIGHPGRVARVAALAPAASLLPVRAPVRLVLRLGPHLPAFTARPTIRRVFGGRYQPDDRVLDLAVAALAGFRSQEGAVIPSVFADDELGRIEAPTLVMVGDRELGYDPEAAVERAATVIAGARTELVAGAGHLLNMERAELVDERLTSFLADEALPLPPAPRPRSVTSEPLSVGRRVVIAALRAGRTTVPVHGLVEVDLTDARRRLAEAGHDASITAFIVASVARAAAAHPQVHRYRNWRGRLVGHGYVDVSTLVEIETGHGSFPLATLIRDADVRDVADISDELRQLKQRADPGARQLLDRFPPVVARLPGLLTALYWLLGRTGWGRRRTGTVSVSSVGMFGTSGGFAVGAPTLASLSVFVGGIDRRARPVGDRLEIREMLDLTLTFDHNVVDGAPAARFATDLRNLLETGAALDPPPGPNDRG